MDVGEWEQVDAVVTETIKDFGRLDILVNNAGIAVSGFLPDLTLERWEKIVRINQTGVFYTCKSAIPHMQRQGGGVIINVASAAGVRAHAMAPSYCATKGAVVNLTRALALDHGDENIRVNAICPGSCETELNTRSHSNPVIRKAYMDTIPVGRFGKPDEIAALAAFLASDEASYITGEAVVIDGGIGAKEGSPDFKRISKDEGWLNPGRARA